MKSSLHSMCSLHEKNDENLSKHRCRRLRSVIIDFKLYLVMVYFHNKKLYTALLFLGYWPKYVDSPRA